MLKKLCECCVEEAIVVLRLSVNAVLKRLSVKCCVAVNAVFKRLSVKYYTEQVKCECCVQEAMCKILC